MLSDEDMARINAGREQYAAEVERIRGSRNLSTEGKRAALGKLTGRERRRRQAIVDQAQEAAETRRAQLDKKLFSLPSGADASTIISWRDALDRAERATDPTELGQLMNRALRSGDQMLVKAALARSYGEFNAARRSNPDRARQWEAAASDAVNALPERDRQQLVELAEIDRRLTHPDNQVRLSLATTVQKPTEIAHLQDHHLDAMADG